MDANELIAELHKLRVRANQIESTMSCLTPNEDERPMLYTRWEVGMEACGQQFHHIQDLIRKLTPERV